LADETAMFLLRLRLALEGAFLSEPQFLLEPVSILVEAWVGKIQSALALMNLVMEQNWHPVSGLVLARHFVRLIHSPPAG
jgi:hypothetical protein